MKAVKIKWQDKIPDTEVLKKAGMQSMHTVLNQTQLRWTGYVIKISDERLPNKVIYGGLQEGKSRQVYVSSKKKVHLVDNELYVIIATPYTAIECLSYGDINGIKHKYVLVVSF